MRIWKNALIGLTAAGLLAAAIPAATLPAAAAGATVAAAGAVQARVPWSKVGPGWVLAEYSPDSSTKPAALYLVAPQGTRYQLASWPSSMPYPPYLGNWSPDGTRALFSTSSDSGGKWEQLTLATGKTTTFRLAGGATPFGYVPPRGADIVGAVPAGTAGNLWADGLFSQAGALIRPLGSYRGLGVLYSASGRTFVAAGQHGLELVSNQGTVIRQLPIPVKDEGACDMVRWWSSGTVLASCDATLWLVPVSGGRPAELFPDSDLGAVDTWQLGSDLYLQTGPIQSPTLFPVRPSTNCAVMRIFKRAANGALRPLTIPGTSGIPFDQVLTVLGSRLLVKVAQVSASCQQSSHSLLWFDPDTGAEQWLIHAPASADGVITAIPYSGRPG